MFKKYALPLIMSIILMVLIISTLADQEEYYVTLTIVNFSTSPTDGTVPLSMKFVQNANSIINLSIRNDSNKLDFNEERTASRVYGEGDLITIGPVNLTAGATYYFNITFDEVAVYQGATPYYYGSCATATAYSMCTRCSGTGSQSCAASTTGGNHASNAYWGATSAGMSAACDVRPTLFRCSDEIQDILDEGLITSFSLGFTI
ncbi:MAG: hypothetical protein ABIC04_01480 [Nanoarchaeota archaeon]